MARLQKVSLGSIKMAENSNYMYSTAAKPINEANFADGRELEDIIYPFESCVQDKFIEVPFLTQNIVAFYRKIATRS